LQEHLNKYISYIRTYIDTRMHTYLYTYRRTYIHTYTTYTLYIYIYIYVYIHIHILGSNYTRTAPAILNTLFISFQFYVLFVLLPGFFFLPFVLSFSSSLFSSFRILFLTIRAYFLTSPLLFSPDQSSYWHSQTSNRFVTDSNSESRTV